MRNPFASKDLSEPLRRRTELAIAVAQERLMSTHVEHALELIELVGDQVPFGDALDIYTRLLHLSEDEARVITTRALASLGERAEEEDPWPAVTARPDGDETALGKRGVFANVKQRLRGRVNDDLRRWIELQAARTEVAILETHVDNAINFVELIGDELPLNDSVELYLEALEVRDSVAEVAYFITLARLSERHLPMERLSRTRPKQPTAEEAAAERKLKVVENERG